MIRDLQPDDIPTYLRMMTELAAHTGNEQDVTATEDALNNKFFGKEPKVFGRILEENGKVIGFTTWWMTFATWFAQHGMWMCELYVDPLHRRSGYGTALVDDLKDICKERHFGGIGWWMDKSNTEATAFYARIGATARNERQLYGLPVN